VPLSHAGIVRKAIGDAGGGKVGNYAHCSFSSEGKGRFLPLEGSDPHIGKIGSEETVSEERIEIDVSIDDIQEVIAAMKAVHPYEEVAYDVYPLIDL
jgi:hypothetical protein